MMQVKYEGSASEKHFSEEDWKRHEVEHPATLFNASNDFTCEVSVEAVKALFTTMKESENFTILEAEDAEEEVDPDQLYAPMDESMGKDFLSNQARLRSLDQKGTKAVLVERINSFDAAQEPS